MTEELQEIIDADAGREDLQLMPEVYTHRRFLIERLKQYDAGIKELGEALDISSDCTLEQLIAEVRERIEMQRGHAAAHESYRDLAAEYHEPFRQAPAEMPAAWTCWANSSHPFGTACNCESAS